MGREIKIYPSKTKLAFLALPCVLAVVVILQADNAPGFTLTDLRPGIIGGLVIAVTVGALVLYMAFEKAPVLVLDDEGLHCRRPPIGLIPWRAVYGAGAGRALLGRRVLMLAVDPNQLNQQAREFVQRSTGFGNILTPDTRRFGRLAKGYATVTIPISLLAMRPRDIEAAVDDYVQHFVVEREEGSA